MTRDRRRVGSIWRLGSPANNEIGGPPTTATDALLGKSDPILASSNMSGEVE